MKKENILAYLTFGSLAILSLGLFMSISLMAGFHALIFVPILFSIKDTNWKQMKVHTWALIIYSLLIPISIFYAKDLPHSLGLYNIMKFKYFLIGAFAATPIAFWFKNKATPNQIRFLFWAILISSSIATIAGIIGWQTGFNPLKMAKPENNYQNAGMFGLSLSYAHSEAVFCVLLFGLILNYKSISKYVPYWLLIIAFVINFIGFYTSFSRGAFIASMLAIPLYFFKKHKKFFFIALISLTTLFIISYFFIPKFHAVFSGRQHSNLLRYGLWDAALKLFELNPLMGVGFRNFQPWSTIIKTQYGYAEPLWEGHAHNNYLEMLADMGLVGFIPFIIWLFGWLYDAYKRNDLIANITFPAVIAIIIGGLTQNTITDGVNVFLFMAIYSIFIIRSNTADDTQ